MEKTSVLKYLLKEKRWFSIWVLVLLIVIILISYFGVFEYLGESDIKNHYDWYTNDGANGEYSSSFSEMEIVSTGKNRYFVENDVLIINFKFLEKKYPSLEEEYFLSSFLIKEINKDGEVLEENNRHCSTTYGCQGRIRLKLETNEIKVIPEIVRVNGTESKKPVVTSIYPDVLEKKELEEKMRNRYLFIGSLFSIILFATAGFVNQLRQIWNDKKN